MLNYLPTKFGDQSHYGSGDIMSFIRQVTSCDDVLKEL